MPETFSQPQTTSLDEQFLNEQIPVGLPWRIMIFAAVVFGFSLFAYFGLNVGYRAYLESVGEDLDAQTAVLTGQISAEEQESLIGFYSQLVNLKGILASHYFHSNIFGFLEENTLSNIFYTEATLTATDNSLALKGEAESLDALVEQMAVFDGASELNRVVLNQTAFEREGTTFVLTLGFRPEFFLRPVEQL